MYRAPPARPNRRWRPERASRARTVPIPDRLAPAYPVARPISPAVDPRFTFGLTLDVARVLEKWGYPKFAAGGDFVELQQALFRFIYGPAPAAAAESIGSPAVTAALGTMDLLARVPAVRASLGRQGIASVDEPAPYLPAAAPTGDAANRATAAALHTRRTPKGFGFHDPLPAGADDEAESDAAVSRLIGVGR
jgi:hypothetical protein